MTISVFSVGGSFPWAVSVQYPELHRRKKMKNAKNTVQKRGRYADWWTVSGFRRSIIAALLAAGFFLLVAAPFACSKAAKHSVLSFFFDGVPSPESDEGKPPGEEPSQNGDGTGKSSKESKKPKIISSHPPHKDRECGECHDMAGSFQVLSSDDSCRNCHEGHFLYENSDWVHGPAATGDCSLCHKGHESQNRALLAAPQPDLCLRCHEAGILMQPYHEAANNQECSTCHDPHFSGNRLLLSDSRTYRRNRVTKAMIQSTHEPWKERKCSVCHASGEYQQVLENLDSICLSCHQKVLDTAKKEKLHAPVRQGKCSLCHASHESAKPHLVRRAGETICYTCHKPQEISGSNHPRIHRADCLICHTGHTSQREHLLKPGIPSGGPAESKTMEPPRRSPAGASGVRLDGGGVQR